MHTAYSIFSLDLPDAPYYKNVLFRIRLPDNRILSATSLLLYVLSFDKTAPEPEKISIKEIVIVEQIRTVF